MHLREVLDICDSAFLSPFVHRVRSGIPFCKFCGEYEYDGHKDICHVVRFTKHREKALIEYQTLEEVADASLNCLFHGRLPTEEEAGRAAKAFRDLEIAQEDHFVDANKKVGENG